MSLKLFNTYTRKKEAFAPVDKKGNAVRMYCCGPTVYNYAHIGNLRTFVFEDLLRRYLKYKGFAVFETMNLTDVDDKTIKGAREAGVPLSEFTSKYTELFLEDCASLHIEKPEVVCRATDHIPEMVENVKQLMDNGFAYKASDGSVYYKISEFKEYGKLSHLDIGNLKAGAGERVAADEYEKEGVADFALWKAWDEQDGEVYWKTELAPKGRPGWHIECSAMSMRYLGNYFDIHCGGVDLIFPHHENEIAQSQPLTGKRMANFWIHGEHLLVDGKKMAKRFKNFYTLREIVQKGYGPLALRYLYLSSHYRQQLNLTFESLDAAKNTQVGLQAQLDKLRNRAKKGKASKELVSAIKKQLGEFESAMDDDLDAPSALAALHSLVKEINKLELTPADCFEAVETLKKIDSVLGVLNWDNVAGKDEKKEIEALIADRQAARKAKDFKKSDEIRNQLLKEHGVVVEDSPTGPVWRKA